MSRTAKTLVLLGMAFAALVWLASALYDSGVEAGQAKCRAVERTADVAVLEGQKATTQKTVDRAALVGARQERTRIQVGTIYATIEKEQAHAPADPVDACVLPADRLRLWAAANAGTAPGEGAATGQHDAPAAASSGTGLRPDARFGVQPHGSGEGLSPAGGADVRPAGLPGDHP